MKMPIKRYVHFHGTFAEKYYDEVLEIHADSMFTFCSILFEQVFPELKSESQLQILFENPDGQMTELFDAEQELDETQLHIHIIPNPDGAWVTAVIALIVAIIAIGVAIMLAPKMDNTQTTASGANWETPENVIGQGGIMPVALGTRLIGSRVVSYGIDSTLMQGKFNSPALDARPSGGGGGGGRNDNDGGYQSQR
ncbi:tail assembly protein [Colwellia phage 9A]|uniref:Tail assembly protein n=1 Tax=Colwellia phage 9A TaxID=765765 RepID=I3UMD5_9CAUD|nr:tail assembly protein [Colwellia phage 9A]AFK66650.1 tail assembly protein [Colwellia phage 9A]